MWYADLKRENERRETELRVAGLPSEAEDQMTLSVHEGKRWTSKLEALQADLRAQVRHVDPIEYSEDRIAQLLSSANDGQRRVKRPSNRLG